MSRQRGCLFTEGRRLRNDKPIFQASDSEIQLDLKKMKYMKQSEPIVPNPQIEMRVKIELPKKRKPTVDDDKWVIDGLLKLMSTKPPEAKKPQPEPEKKTEAGPKQFYQNPALATYLMLQSQMFRNNMYMSQFQYAPFQPLPLITSSADRHLKAALFIQSHKALMKSNLKG